MTAARNWFILVSDGCHKGAKPQSCTMSFSSWNDKLNENRAINKFFAPEFRNRLDCVVSFDSLSLDIVSKVAGKFIEDLEKQLEGKKIKIEISKKAKDELAKLGYDKAMGARPLNRVISEKIKKPLTDEILFGKLKKGGVVKIDFKDDFVFIYE